MNSGFREVPHTADWELYVYAPDLSELLKQAAAGMGALAGVTIDRTQPHHHSLSLDAGDTESLLVAFLSEILWLGEHDQLAFDQFDVSVSGQSPLHLESILHGGRLLSVDKEIKAVTWHRLAVRSTPSGVETNIVFDV